MRINDGEDLDLDDQRTLGQIIDGIQDSLDDNFDEEKRTLKIEIYLTPDVEDYCAVSKMKKCNRSMGEVSVSRSMAAGAESSATSIYDLLHKFSQSE